MTDHAIDWRARWQSVCEANTDEARNAYDKDWMQAYCAEFRSVAKARGWSEEHIESGWLDELPREALAADCWRAPEEVAAEDVIACEEAAQNG